MTDDAVPADTETGRCGPWGSCAVVPGCPCGSLNWWQRITFPIYRRHMHRLDRKARR